MYRFNYYQPTEIIFGCGRINEIGQKVAQYGTRCLLVTVPEFSAIAPVYKKVKRHLEEEGIKVIHFDKVVENPTTDVVNEGSEIAKANNIDVVIGLGGGSSMDTAKAIAVGGTHEGCAWDYKLFSNKKITEKTLPIIAISTTSGTGSQVTAVSVITNSKEKLKYALCDKLIFPKAAIIDPEIMITVPKHITASTGFDAFCHSFEGYIHKDSNPYTDSLALESIKRVIKYLPNLLTDLSNKEARTEMALADTYAGLVISNSGTTLPHGIGMAIGGHAPHVKHGEALASVYPEFAKYTYTSSIDKFAKIARMFNTELKNVDDIKAAELFKDEITKFIKEIGMYATLSDLNVDEKELKNIADDTMKLPDYSVNPKVPSRDEVFTILKRIY